MNQTGLEIPSNRMQSASRKGDLKICIPRSFMQRWGKLSAKSIFLERIAWYHTVRILEKDEIPRNIPIYTEHKHIFTLPAQPRSVIIDRDHSTGRRLLHIMNT